MMNRLFPIFALVAFVSAHTAQGQVVLDEAKELKDVGVTEKLGDTIPLDLKFTNANGEPVVLGDYFNDSKPVVLSLAYYECPMLCTLVLNGVAQALQGLNLKAGRDFNMVTVSIDETEGPDLAKAKQATYESELGDESFLRWDFLTGASDQSKALADALGFGYRFDEKIGEWAHPSVVFLITPEGKISRYLYGIAHQKKDIRLALLEASNGRIGTTLERVLLYCYRYDPAAGSYTLIAWNVMKLGGLLTILGLGTLLGFFWIREGKREDTTEPLKKEKTGAKA